MTHRQTARRVCAGIAAVAAGGLLTASQRLPNEPFRAFGTSITAAFEGWFENPDGSKSFLVGYLNRNSAQSIDVPLGANNRIEPDGPDYGQPTHFLPGRQYGMFVVTVPKTFTPQDKLTWTIVANGQSTSVPFRLHPDYAVSPFHDVAVNNTPPVLRFEPEGPPAQGPVARLSNAVSRSASVSTPLALTIWPSDDALFASWTMAVPRDLPPPVQLEWSKYRGPGTVTFDKAKPALETLEGGGVNDAFRGKATTMVTFSEPGDYVLHVTATDYSGPGGGGEVCCWTTALVKVSVTP